MSGGGNASPPQGPVVFLIDLSRAKMDHAVKAWLALNYGDCVESAAAAVEYLSKAALFSINPALLAETGSSHEKSLVALSVDGASAVADPNLRTIGGERALSRLMLVPQFQRSGPPSDSSRLFQARNASIHIGARLGSAGEHLQTSMVLVTSMFPLLSLTANVYFGQHEQRAKDILNGRMNEISRRVNAYRMNSTERLEKMFSQLSPPVVKVLVETGLAGLVSGNTPLLPDHYAVRHGCLVCSNTAVITGYVEADPVVNFNSEKEPDGGFSTAAVLTGYDFKMHPERFRCFVCDLRLSSRDELREAILPYAPFNVAETDLLPSFAEPHSHSQDDYLD